MFLASYEGPGSEEYEHDYSYDVSYSMSWASSDPDVSEAPQSDLCIANTKHRASRVEQSSEEYEHDYSYDVSYSMSWTSSDADVSGAPQSDLRSANRASRVEKGNDAHRASAKSGQCRNPLPCSGSRRDACAWSAGSHGHESGRCNELCKDLPSEGGCTCITVSKMCHLPHPDVSSTPIKSKKSKAKEEFEQLYATELDRQQQPEHLVQSDITMGQATNGRSSTSYSL